VQCFEIKLSRESQISSFGKNPSRGGFVYRDGAQVDEPVYSRLRAPSTIKVILILWGTFVV
jgi:hypothetical protein